MKFTSALTLVSAILLAASPIHGALLSGKATTSSVNALANQIKDTYIVKLRDGNQARQFITGVSTLSGRNHRHVYEGKAFQGFATQLSSDEHATLTKDPRVEYIEKDGIVHITGTQKSPPSWGLSRVSEKKLDLSQPFVYPDSDGSGIEAWIVDTGVDGSHSDFGGRASTVTSFVTGEDATDLNGHGTHVSGTIGSKTYGIAKKASIHGVKVLDADGSGSFSDVIAGINYVASNATPNKSVANLSLGGSKSQAVDDAVNAAVNAGVAFFVAAGNDSGVDACTESPSGAAKAFTVAASDKTDTQAYFSNIGKCVKLYAPGVDITSLWLNGSTNTISGTSMATPHVAGVAAVYLGTGKYSSVSSLYGALTTNATPSVLKSVGKNTPNKLLYLPSA